MGRFGAPFLLLCAPPHRHADLASASFRHHRDPAIASTGDAAMLETVAVLLILLWALGYFTAYTMGGLIHLLLVIAVVVIAIRLLRGQRI
jgi:fatty acid desaturase